MSDAVLLAVDGGATKTDLALVGANGSLLALQRGPLSSEERRVGKECRSRWSPYH